MSKPSVVAPLALVTTVTAWMSLTPQDNNLRMFDCERAWVTAAACACGVGLGMLLDTRALRASLSKSLMVVLAAAAPLGALAGAARAVPWAKTSYDQLAGPSAWSGGIAGLLLIPVASMLVWLAHRTAGGRPGSLLWDVDRRAMWAVAAAFVTTVGSLAYIRAQTRGMLPSTMGSAVAVTLAFSAVAAIAVLWMWLANVFVQRRVTQLAFESIRMAPCDGQARDDKLVDYIDLGVGEQEVGRRAKVEGSAYRSVEPLVLVLKGSVEDAQAGLRRGSRRTGLMAFLAIVGVAVELLVYAFVGASSV